MKMLNHSASVMLQSNQLQSDLLQPDPLQQHQLLGEQHSRLQYRMWSSASTQPTVGLTRSGLRLLQQACCRFKPASGPGRLLVRLWLVSAPTPFKGVCR